MNTQARPITGKRKTPGRSILRWPPHRWALALVLASIAWRLVRYGLVFPIWGDEAFIAVNFITRSFSELTGPLDHPQIVPAGFLWAQWGVSRVLGTSELALRLLPILAGIGSVLVFWRLAPRMVSRRQAMAAVVIFAASYYPVRHSVEVKSYSLDLLIALGLLWQAWSLWLAPRSLARWGVFFLSGALAVWVSYPAVFIIGGPMLVLACRLIKERKPAPLLAGWALGGAVMAGSFLTMWMLVAVGQKVNHKGIEDLAGWASAFPPMDSLTGLIVWFFRAHTGNMVAYPAGGNHGGSTATFCLILLGIIALWRTGQRALLCMLLSPLPLMFIAAALKKYPYGDSARVQQHIAPAVCLLAGVGLVALLNHGWKRRGAVSGMRIVSVVMLGIITYGVIRDFREPYKKESDLISLQTVRQLAEQTQLGDRWIVFGSLVDQEHAPNLVNYGGSLARFRYDLLQHRPPGSPGPPGPLQTPGTAILWAPTPDEVSPLDQSATFVIFYRDDRKPYPQEQAQRYLDAITQRLGEPTRQTFSFRENNEEVTVYRFGDTGG